MKFWKKVKNSLRKDFHDETVYNEKYLNAKINVYNRKINTNLHNNKIPKEGSQFICLPVILSGSVFRTDKKIFSQAILEECKYVVKEKNILQYNIDNLI